MIRLKIYPTLLENILFAAIMVIVVAAADLSLPDLLSQIINVGIQQRGIQSAVPNALSVITMQDLQALQTQEEHARLLSFYELIEPGTPPLAEEKASEISSLEKEAVYLLKPTDETQKK